MHNVYFIASLSNGDTVTEGKGAYTVTTGELSPYQRLLAFCAANNVTITSLSLAMADGRRWNVPSAGKNPKFKAFAETPQPTSYRFFRKMGGDVMGTGAIEKPDNYAVAEAIYADGKRLQMWVDEATGNAWSLLL